ncbi:MAG: hypothetical protein ACUVWP_09005 [bacterium]
MDTRDRFIIVLVCFIVSGFFIAFSEGNVSHLKPLTGQFWVEDDEIILEGTITLANEKVIEGSFATFSKYIYIMPKGGGGLIDVPLMEIAKLERKGRRQIYVELIDGTNIDGEWASSPSSAKAIFIHNIENNTSYIISLDNKDFHVSKNMCVVRFDSK